MVRPRSVKSVAKSDTESSGTRSNEPLLADNFPSKAYLVIENCDATNPEVACWSEDGSYFVVKNTPTFAASHLPRYFKHSNFQSFVRQLNIYGFRTCKDYVSSDGSVAFHHKAFQRGRRDLLANIKRSKKPPKKQADTIQEEKKEDYASFNSRFDEMQRQMDSMNDKLDLLISLVSAKPEGFFNNNIHVGIKRRRQDAGDGRGSPVSDITDPTAVSKESSSSDSESSQPAALPRFRLDMEVVDEEEEELENESNVDTRYGDLMELQESTRELDDASNHYASSLERTAAAAPSQEEDKEEEDADFKMFIDKMLDGNEDGGSTASDEESDQDEHFAAAPLRGKENPPAIHGSTLVPQTTVSAVAVHADEDYDEETGEVVVSTPLTTAVEVTDDSYTRRKLFSRRTKIFIAAVILMVLAAFIIWPVVIYVGGKNKRKKKPHPPHRPYGGGGGNRPGGGKRPGGNGGRGRGSRSGNGVARASDNVFGDARSIPDEKLTLGLDGLTYQCIALRPPF